MPTDSSEVSIARPELKRAISGFGFFALAFGSMIGVGWITALGGWFEQAGPVGAMIAFAAGGTIMLAFVFTGFITAINYFGVGIASRVQIVLTALFLLCAVLFVVSGIASGEIGNLAPYFGDSALGRGGLAGMLAVFVTGPFWYVGFDTIPQAAEERREGSPLHRLGLYVILAIIGSTVFYIAIILGAGMTAPWRSIVGEELPTAAAFSSAFESQFLVRLVLVAGLIGLLTSWNGFFLAGSRVLFSLGRGHIIHGSFGQTHPRFGTAAGSLFILCVMLIPGSPSMLVWPLEWLILGTLSATGLGFWFAARRYRQRVSEEDRAKLILENYAS